MKNFLTILVCALSLSISVHADTKVSNQKLIFDGKDTDVKGYIINDMNHFKLRDIASLLASTDASFSVNYNAEKNIIEISRDGNYKKTENDLKPLEDTKSKPKATSQKVLVDGEEIFFNSYLIDNFNYFSLRELGRVIGFYVNYDNENNYIILKSEKLKPLSVTEHETEVTIIDIGTKINRDKTFSLKENFKLNINNFFENIDSTVLMSKEAGQLSANQSYDNNGNLITCKPLMKIYKGSISYKPIILIEQGNKKEFFTYEKEFDIKDLLKKYNFEENKSFSIFLGYYVGDEKSDNFRKLSQLNYR